MGKNKKTGITRWLLMLAVLALVAAACSSSDDSGSTETTAAAAATETTAASDVATQDLRPVKLQLQWFTQAQFAGYFAALDQGFYAAAGLDVEILEGGVDIVPATVLDSGAADFAISWVPRGLVPREEGLNITNISQVFQRSATLQVSFVDSGISKTEDLAGKTVGNWGFGNEFELLAGLRASGLDPDTDVTLVQQQFDMLALISGDIDAAQAMIYNEYAQVLETVNPDTGELFQPEDLAIIDWNDVGTAMLQDAIWADADKLESDEEYKATAVAFVEASLRGWAFCRDEFDACVDIVLAAGPTLGESHQAWQLNEINNLIWPSPQGVGTMDSELWDQTVEVAVSEGILADQPTDGAFVTDITTLAQANLAARGIDIQGTDWTPKTIELLEGGE
ncbi:MAG: ABC transporter substrate-binding protein [Actinomycetia bacterium]|nr:ABC transporter substrate-binding protein [Actinomycetes bacterium]